MPKPVAGFNKNPQNINRAGAPTKEWTMAELYRQAGEEADATGVPRNKIVAGKLWQKAQRGDVVAIKELNNRLDGMATQKVEQTGSVEVVHIYKPEKNKE